MTKQKCRVHITRKPTSDSFDGTIIGETTSHYSVTHEMNEHEGELFAKNADMVRVELT